MGLFNKITGGLTNSIFPGLGGGSISSGSVGNVVNSIFPGVGNILTGGGISGLGGAQQNGVQTSTTNTSPWSGIQPYLTGNDTTPGLYPSAANYYASGGPQYYPGQTYVDPSQATQQSWQMQANRAMGSPLDFASQQNLLQTLQGQGLYSNPAFGYLGQTASGGMLNSNPYIDKTFQQAADAIKANTGSVFEQGGRYGSGQHAGVLGQQLGNTAAQMYGQNYANERQNQLNAANTLGNLFAGERQNQMGGLALAPQISNQDYTNIAALGNLGQQQEAYQMNPVTEAMNRWNFNQNQPFNMLQQYSSILNPGLSAGGTSVTSQPIYTNPIAGLLGGGLAGGSLFGLPGAAIGAGLGYLGSR